MQQDGQTTSARTLITPTCSVAAVGNPGETNAGGETAKITIQNMIRVKNKILQKRNDIHKKKS